MSMNQILICVVWGKIFYQVKDNHCDQFSWFIHFIFHWKQCLFFEGLFLIFYEDLLPHPCTLVCPSIGQSLDCVRDRHKQVFYLRYIHLKALMVSCIPRQMM